MVKIIIAIMIWLITVPGLLGALAISGLDREDDRLAECMVAGYLMMFAVCQISAVPMILLKASFHIFCIVLAVLYLFLCLLGLVRGGRWLAGRMVDLVRGLFHHAWTVYAAVAAGTQCHETDCGSLMWSEESQMAFFSYK